MGLISVYNLGKLGVNVDKTAVHLEDGELTKAQNAIPDTAGHDGGIRKRPGLAQFNSSALSGSALGGVGVPITLKANLINGQTVPGGPTRKIFWGRCTTATNLSTTQGWWTSTDLFATAAGTVAASDASGLPSAPRAGVISELCTSVLSGYNGSPGSGVVVNNKFYYASNNYTLDSTAPCIRVFDGTIDEEFLRIPIDPSVSSSIQCQGILSMLAVGDFIYLTVYDDDDGTIGTGSGGRVFRMDPSAGSLIQIGAKFVTDTSGADHIPYALEFHAGRLWVGTLNRQSAAGIAGKVYWIRPLVDTAWTLDDTPADTGSRGVAFLKSFQGQLFAGHIDGGTNALVRVRSSVGTWSTSLTRSSPAQFHNAIVFENNLYCSSHNATTNESYIHKFDGSSWSIVHTTTAGAEEVALPMCWQENGTLFFGGGGSDSGDAALLSSTDGTTWTSRTANLTAHTGLNCIGVLVL